MGIYIGKNCCFHFLCTSRCRYSPSYRPGLYSAKSDHVACFHAIYRLQRSGFVDIAGLRAESDFFGSSTPDEIRSCQLGKYGLIFKEHRHRDYRDEFWGSGRKPVDTSDFKCFPDIEAIRTFGVYICWNCYIFNFFNFIEVSGDTNVVRGYQTDSEGLTVNLKDKIFFSIVFVVLFSIFVMAVFGEKGLLDLYRLKKEHAELSETNKEIARENKSLLIEINRLKTDLAYVESVARKDLGFITKDEIIFQTKTTPVK